LGLHRIEGDICQTRFNRVWSCLSYLGGGGVFLRYLYALPELVATLLALAIVASLMRRRLQSQLPGLTTFILFILSTAVWSLSGGLAILSQDPTVHYLWARLGYLGIAPLPALWFIFVWRYTSWRGGIAWSNAIWFFALPLVTFVMAWTNDLHFLHWKSVRFNETLTPPMLETPWGPWFWYVHLPYSYGLLLMAALILISRLRGSPKTYRKQLFFLLIAGLLPFIGNAFYLAGFHLLGDLDSTPLSFVLSGCIVVYALYRYRLLNLAPIAYQAVFDSLPDSVIVLNPRDEIVDTNPSAETLLGKSRNLLIGSTIQSLFHNWEDLMAQYQATQQISLRYGSDLKHLDVRVAPLRNSRKEFVGRVIIAQDVSERKIFQEQANRDPLTNLANRRAFQLEGADMLVQAKQDGFPVALLYLDLDKFKPVNDTFGHEVGDVLLQKVAVRLKETLRATDLLARIGGDEFVLMLHRTEGNNLVEVCNRLLSDIRRPFYVSGQQLNLGVSIGIAFYPDQANDLDELLKRADSAMYEAKHAGSGFKFYVSETKSTRL
jgi:diguanylate cyclase (GGDEF)-like protein/PAS domain S-box-containing protein